ncbi:MAG: CHAT domain-containing protein [Betaproteobacteria bacterium]|nr:CHAT domain-containing protein [Betaproteobacteria bacterium]
MLDEAKRANAEVLASKQKEAELQKHLDVARRAEAEAKASGDVAKQRELAEQTKQREAELLKQAELTKQREAAAEKQAELAKQKQDQLEKDKLAKMEGKAPDSAAKAAAEKAPAEKAAAQRAEAERFAAETAAAEKAAAEPAAAEAATADRSAAARAAAARAAAEKAAAAERGSEKLALEKAREEREIARQKESGAYKAPPAEKAAVVIPPEQLAKMDPKEVAFREAELLEGTNARAAVRAYTRLANEGYPKAMVRIAQIYNNGLGNVTKDYAETLKWKAKCEAAGVDCGFGRQFRDSGSASASTPQRVTASTNERIERFPTIEAPDVVDSAQVFVVQVSLTEEQITPDVTATPGAGTTVTPAGRIVMTLPPEGEAWTIDVALTARGFVLVDGSNLGRTVLPRRGDSSPAVFKLKPDAAFQGSTERKLYATLIHKGHYLARLSKAIRVGKLEERVAKVAGAQRGGGAPRAEAAVEISGGHRAADLTVIVIDLAPAGKAGSTEVIVVSPHLQPERETIQRPADMEEWIQLQYGKIMVASQLAGIDKLKPVTIPLVDGLGAQLYDAFAPPSFRRAYAQLDQRLGNSFQSIQIITNNPALPWELMRPLSANGQRHDFLASSHRVARWHLVSDGRELPRPTQQIPLREIVAIAPRYAGGQGLPSQSRELEAVRRMPGTRVIDGRLKTVSELFKRRPDGIIHFIGHGEVTRGAGGLLDYAIKLEDATLDVTTWRGLTDRGVGRGALVFFNACDIGQASRAARFVDGWAPAMLEAGAGGYIGGLWPLFDRGAADFATRFYTSLSEGIKTNQVVVSELLRNNRRLFRETGDPTFAAYVMYGDVNLRVERYPSGPTRPAR